MYFDINSPLRGGVNDINNVIGAYASPEAAQTDLEANAPQGTEYLRKQYRGLTGDEFADPFQDASRVRTAALTDAAMNGASLAVGGRMGGEVLMAPPIAAEAAPTVGRRRLLQPAAAAANAVTTYGGSTGPQVMGPPMNPLDRPELQLPDTSDDNFSKVQQMRISQIGGDASALFQNYAHNNPSLLKPPITHDQSLEYDDKGRPIAGDVLHKDLYNDKKFQMFLRSNPNEAYAFYKGVTGRDLTGDMHMQIAHEQSVTKRHTAAIDKFSEQGGSFDEVTGEPYTTKLAKDPNDPFGPPVTTRNYDLSYETKQLLKNSTAYKTATGIDQPEAANMQGAGGPLSPDQEDKLRTGMVTEAKLHPENSRQQNELAVRRRLFGVESGNAPPSLLSRFAAANTGFGNAILRPAINLGIRGYNQITSSTDLPELGQIPPFDLNQAAIEAVRSPVTSGASNLSSAVDSAANWFTRHQDNARRQRTDQQIAAIRGY